MHDKTSAMKNAHCPTLDRGNLNERSQRIGWKKFLSFTIVGIMIISSLAMIAPSINLNDAESEKEVPAEIEYGGTREVTYTMSNFFESYLKPTDYSELGRHNSTSGLNEWFTGAGLREQYGEYYLRNSYPYIISYEPYSLSVSPDNDVGYLLMTPYRLAITANNITECNTTFWSNQVPGNVHFAPLRSGAGGLSPGDPGGWINMSLYMTYMTHQELVDVVTNEIHYGNTYYGFESGKPDIINLGTESDGYWFELQGYLDFNVESSKKYLDLPGTGDLRTEWNTTTSDSAQGHDIEWDWFDKWMIEGGGGATGIYDIYTAYDWSNDVRTVRNILDWRNSTADSIRVRIYTLSWGMDVLMPRYLEACNVTPYWQTWNEDWYLNATIGPEMADFEMSATTWYHMTAGKDSDVFMGAWSFAAEHLDWAPNSAPQHIGYASPYNDYDPAATDIMRPAYSPGTTQYGNDVSFWVTPMLMNLSDGENMIIELPTNDVLGYEPHVGTSDDVSVQAKKDELASKSYWGELVLGNCTDPIESNYDAASKTITINGPVDFWSDRIPNSGDSSLLEGGSPSFSFVVSNVSDYDVSIEAQAQYLPGVAYTLTITAKNQSGSTITGWNGTVTLSCSDPGATFPGGSSHAFVPATDNGVWTTTVQFSADGTWYINATDGWFAADVTGSLQVTAVPEFPMLLIPVIGAIAIFMVFRTRKRREDE